VVVVAVAAAAVIVVGAVVAEIVVVVEAVVVVAVVVVVIVIIIVHQQQYCFWLGNSKAHDTRPKFLVQVSRMRNSHEKLVSFVMHSRTRFFSYEKLGWIRTCFIFSRETWHHLTQMNLCVYLHCGP